MYDEVVTILENKKINSEYFKLSFSSKRLARNVKPGQFLQIQLERGTDPLLRRPFSYYRVTGSRIELLYEILGRGTGILARKRRGDKLKALGPLGKPFTQKIRQKKRVLVAGGVGVPPLVFLAERVRPNRHGGEEAYLLIGCGTKTERLSSKELAKVNAKIGYATDDGTYGVKGFVTQLLKAVLESENANSLYIQTCGPQAMMEAVIKMARDYGVAGEASLEERMACGIGTCLGCAVETTEGYKPSCVEGPVFKFDELKK